MLLFRCLLILWSSGGTVLVKLGEDEQCVVVATVGVVGFSRACCLSGCCWLGWHCRGCRGRGRKGIPGPKGLSWSDTESLLTSKRGASSAVAVRTRSASEVRNVRPRLRFSLSNFAAWKRARLEYRPVQGRSTKQEHRGVYLKAGDGPRTQTVPAEGAWIMSIGCVGPE